MILNFPEEILFGGIVMNRIRLLAFMLVLVITPSTFSQNVVTRRNKYLLIQIPPSADIQLGDQFDVSRKAAGKRIQKVGTARVVKIQGNKCACEIVSENTRVPIQSGDFMQALQTPADMEIDFLKDDYADNKPVNINTGHKRDNNSLKYLTIVAGAASCGLGYYYNDKANDIYKDYKAAETAQDASRLYKRTVNYDKNTNLAVGVGGGLIVLGVVYPLLRSYLTSHSSYSLDVDADHDRVRLSLNVPIRKN
jgi:hypothetical protein